MPLNKNIIILRNPKQPILAAECSTYRWKRDKTLISTVQHLLTTSESFWTNKGFTDLTPLRLPVTVVGLLSIGWKTCGPRVTGDTLTVGSCGFLWERARGENTWRFPNSSPSVLRELNNLSSSNTQEAFRLHFEGIYCTGIAAERKQRGDARGSETQL